MRQEQGYPRDRLSASFVIFKKDLEKGIYVNENFKVVIEVYEVRKCWTIMISRKFIQ